MSTRYSSLVCVALCISAAILRVHSQSDDSRAEVCDPDKCRLPNCHCGGIEIPGGLKPDEIPQLVLLTFDDAVNTLNKDFFEQLFKDRVNPNGCPIKATFYVSHEWTDYSQVQNLYADGHEIATHTVTHSHGTKFNEERWANEVIGQAEILVRFAGVDPVDIKGMRAPFLAVGGDTMFNMLNRYGLYYDSSMSVSSPGWPYTLDYRMTQSCAVKPCPRQSHPGMWEVPMTTLKDIRGGSCSMADGCFYEEDAASIQKIFTQNFLDHYTKSKAPFPLFFHAAWFFNRAHRRKGFFDFIDSILRLPDVYFVTSQEIINYTRHPQTLDNVVNSSVFACDFPRRPKRCEKRDKKACRLKHRGDARQWASCQRKCPNRYPWVNNLNGD